MARAAEQVGFDSVWVGPGDGDDGIEARRAPNWCTSTCSARASLTCISTWRPTRLGDALNTLMIRGEVVEETVEPVDAANGAREHEDAR